MPGFFVCLFLCLFILFKYSWLHFQPDLPWPHLPLPPFSFVNGSLIHGPWWPFPFFPLLSPSLLPSGYCQFVLYFYVSAYIWSCFYIFVHWYAIIVRKYLEFYIYLYYCEVTIIYLIISIFILICIQWLKYYWPTGKYFLEFHPTVLFPTTLSL